MSEFPEQAHGNLIADDAQQVVYSGNVSLKAIEQKSQIIPAAIHRTGTAGRFAWEEFFQGQIRNRNTRKAYLHAVQRFLAWVDPYEADLSRITPGLVGRYFDDLPYAIPTKKLHLSAIRQFFDVLVIRHVVVLNPAASVRTERYSDLEGKTPVITPAEVRTLLASVVGESPADFRDKAILATLTFTAARVGAIARLRVRDLAQDGGQFVLRFREKGGKDRAIPVRHDLQQWLLDYRQILNLQAADRDTPFFRSLTRQGTLSSKSLSGISICRMVKRRLAAAGLPTSPSPHSFRSCAATDLLMQGVGLEDVQHLLGHSDSRVTKLYDRRQRQVTRNIVERISV